MIDDELASTVRRAASDVPARTHELAAVVRRRRAYQRRRTMTTAGLAAATVAVAIAAVPLARSAGLAGPADGNGPAANNATPAPASTPAQRLVLRIGDIRHQPGHNLNGEGNGPLGPEFGIDAPDGTVEVQADGGLVAHRWPAQIDGPRESVPLPDGRLVQVGPQDRTRTVNLVVVGADGAVQISREVRGTNEYVRLVGATAQFAYLLRDERRIVRHDLTTGAEQPLDGATSALARLWRDQPEGVSVSVQGDRVVQYAARGERPVRVRVADLATGASVLDLQLDEALATQVTEVRLSPDGRLAAVHATRVTGAVDRAPTPLLRETRLLLVDVPSGRIVANRVIIESGTTGLADVVGLAWTDRSTLRVAWYALPPNASRIYPLADVLRIDTL